jgi:hypothetical protein
MARPKTKKTKLMRVPECFDKQVDNMCKRYNYKNKTTFLEKEGTVIFQNVDFINKVFNPFRKGKKK